MLALAVPPMTPYRKERRKRPSLSQGKRVGKRRISDPYSQIQRSVGSAAKPSTTTTNVDIADDPTIETNCTFFDDEKKEFKIVTNEQKWRINIQS